MKIAPHFLRLVVWRLVVLAAICAYVPKQTGAAAGGVSRRIPELRLKNGTVLHDVSVVAVGSTTLVAKWDGGQGSILLKLLPDELRTELAPPVAAVSRPVNSSSTPPIELDPKLASAELPTEIRLTNGFVMHKSAVTRWEPNSVLVSYQGGIVVVRFANIVPEQRAIFEARKEEALARQAKEDAKGSVGQDNAAKEEQARQAAAVRDQDAADRKAEEIRNGISFHYLVKGMTKEQVKLAFGRPADDKGDTFFYPSRGHDKYGNSADRLLVFEGGFLASWRDQRENDVDGGVDH